MKLRMCTIQIQKEKVLYFFEKEKFLDMLNFFSKGGTLLSKKFFSVLQKISKTNSKNEFSRTI